MKTKTQLHVACVLLALILGACGGGGAKDPAGEFSASTTPPRSTPSPTLGEQNFKSIVAPTGFRWETRRSEPAVGLTLKRASNASIGEVRITISNYIDRDPTGSGEQIAPISTDVITTTTANSREQPTLIVPFGHLAVPNSVEFVLVEVFSQKTGNRLASSLIATRQLLAGTTTLNY